MNTAQLTPRAQAVIAASDEYTAPIFRGSEGNATRELLKDLRWRIADVRETLMSSWGERRIYGCDEWSTPVVNLQRAMDKIDRAIVTQGATS
jgi:hypothetical protein